MRASLIDSLLEADFEKGEVRALARKGIFYGQIDLVVIKNMLQKGGYTVLNITRREESAPNRLNVRAAVISPQFDHDLPYPVPADRLEYYVKAQCKKTFKRPVTVAVMELSNREFGFAVYLSVAGDEAALVNVNALE